VPEPTPDDSWFVSHITRRPKNLMWEITDACNMRCLHCEASAGRRHPDELSHDEAMAVCDQIVEMGWPRVNITGGEPLVRKDWADIASKLAAGGCSVALVTNALLFSDEVARKAADLGVATVSFSLDGGRETHDRIRVAPGKGRSSYDAVFAGIRRARDCGLQSVVITHINRWNYDELRTMHARLTESGVGGWQLQLAVPLGRLRELEEPYMLPVEQLPALDALCASFIESRREKEVGPRIAVMHSIGYYGKNEMTIRRGYLDKQRFFVGCVAGWRLAALTSDGKVKPCAMAPRGWATGDLHRQTLADIWENRDQLAYQPRWSETKLEGHCRGCQYRFICRGGCASMAYALTGTIYNNPYCIYGQATGKRGGGR